MEKKIKIFKSFEEQVNYFMEYFFLQTPAERLKAFAKLQIKNNNDFLMPSKKKITVQKHFLNGHRAS